jgi:hypothetical protein
MAATIAVDDFILLVDRYRRRFRQPTILIPILIAILIDKDCD